MIDVAQLFRGEDLARQELELSLKDPDFPDIQLAGPIHVEAELMRMRDGILLMIDEMDLVLKMDCVRCAKALEVPVQIRDSEWMFYDHEKEEELLGDAFLINVDQLTIDPIEAIHQELLLNTPDYPHCDEDCAHFDESGPEENKALSGLKDLV